MLAAPLQMLTLLKLLLPEVIAELRSASSHCAELRAHGRRCAKGCSNETASRDQLGQMVVARGVGLEVTELLLLLGVQPLMTTSLFWRLVKAAVLVGHT